MEEQVDIDKLLVVTFTNAAASEMRERILEAIYKKLEEEPENMHLQRQITLLNRANICTIHAFCLDVIKNNFFEIDTSANFRIGDTAEIALLKQDVLEDVLEEKYLEKEVTFLDVLDTYTNYKDDTPLKDMVLDIYDFIQSSPFPEEWLQQKVDMFQIDEQDFAGTIWGKILMESAKEELEDAILQLKGLQREMVRFDTELLKYIQVIQADINELEAVQKQTSWENMAEAVMQIDWKKWPVDKKVTLELKEDAKNRRDAVKKKLKQLQEKYFAFSSEEAVRDMRYMLVKLQALQRLVLEFSEAFAQKKKERNMLDFNDIEHFALQILVKRAENGKIEETEVAKRYKQKFAEVAIDEYQDSNLVQEYILSSISTGNNMFMVGDVKQSIYKFRQARPDLFMEKYRTYSLISDRQEGDNTKIQLFKNFRSRKQILDITNRVFENIMSKKLGEMDYTEEEYLNLGAQYEPPKLEGISYAGRTELHIIDVKDPEADTTFIEEEEEETTEIEKIEDVVVEAKFVANKMKELLESNYYVWDKKKGYRKITYKDIAVLLRSTQTVAPIYEKEIARLEIPVFCDSQTGYLDSMEVQTIVSLLKIIDNPMQDIPLVHVLRSSIAGFTDNELVQIRLCDTHSTFYEAMLKAQVQLEEEALREKVVEFLARLEKWKKRQEYDALDTFLWYLYQDTNFYHYVGLMKNGAFRQANLKILFEKAKQYEKASFKGLFHFIHFIEKLHTNSGDFGAAKLIGENENVVRIMSIHKSKGLEFPVVFLCGTGKQINMQDVNKPIVLHQEFGFGPKYKNAQTKVEYATLAKEAIKIRSQIETVSEEMRVLYVAFTRAREKLIITGLDKNTTKSLIEKERLLSMYPYKGRIDSKLVKKYKRYLDWIELVYLQNKEACEELLTLYTYTKKEVLQSFHLTEEVVEQEALMQKFMKEAEGKWDKEALQKWEQMLCWEYPYRALCDAPTKTSVTQLKEWKNGEKKEEEKLPEVMPTFLKPDLAVSRARKGTIMHLCLQKLPERKEAYTKEELQTFVQKLQEKGILLEKEAECVSIDTIYAYTQSSLYKELQEAQAVYKEQPFYTSVPVQEVQSNMEEAGSDTVLVQGIVDLYYRDKAGKLVLVDYKTDFILPGAEETLVEKYKEQLYLYKKALEEALHEKVDRMYIEALGRTDGKIVSILVE